MNRYFKILMFISLFIIKNNTYSQNNDANSIIKLQTANNNKEYKEEKNYWLPAGEILVINTLVLLKARFIEDED